MTVYRNKWNGNDYILVKKEGGMATLQRKTDGSRFTIEVKELYSNYFEKQLTKQNKNVIL